MKKILIIDNCQIIRCLLTEFMDELGYTVDTAVNGQEGIEKATKGNYDVVFCDIHMPKGNGYQVYTKVSKVLPNLPFIMTDSLPDDLADKALSQGARTCLTKPFTLDQVRSALDSIFAGEKIS